MTRAAPPRIDVESLRSLDDDLVMVRTTSSPVIVLGSAQPASIAQGAGIEVVRRRGGGGAVLVDEAAMVWIDVWIPSSSLRHRAEVAAGRSVLGEAWAGVLGSLGIEGASVIVKGDPPSPVCFASRGQGEVSVAGRKVVGLATWRCRQGSLHQAAIYRHLDVELPGILSLEPAERAAAERGLHESATDLDRLGLGEVGGLTLAELVATALAAEGDRPIEVANAPLLTVDA